MFQIHTLLTNVPPEAKYFTVIYLCSAFFSIPVMEESRYLFAFTYAGKHYIYLNATEVQTLTTNISSGFKS